MGATLAFPLDRNNSIKFHTSGGVATKTGSDFKLFFVAWQHRWGSGL